MIMQAWSLPSGRLVSQMKEISAEYLCVDREGKYAATVYKKEDNNEGDIKLIYVSSIKIRIIKIDLVNH